MKTADLVSAALHFSAGSTLSTPSPSHDERGARVLQANALDVRDNLDNRSRDDGLATDATLALRGDRVTHHRVSKSPSGRFETLAVTALASGPDGGNAPSRLRSIPASLKTAVAAPMMFAAEAGDAISDPQPAPQMLLAAFDPRPSAHPRRAAMQAVSSTEADVPLPSFESAVDAEAAVSADAGRTDEPAVDPHGAEAVPASAIAAIAMPMPRPEMSEPEGMEVASLEPGDLPAQQTTATDALANLVAPLPQKRPDFRPSETSAAPSVLAYARPGAPSAPAARDDLGAIGIPAALPSAPAARDPAPANGGPSFFEKLFGRGGSGQLPGAGSRIAVYEIKTATVYLPGDGRLEAHSGLGHMQDNPRYVTQKNRGPTPPNIYNLRMRESRFHGAEAIRLLPMNGRKKYNRDGLLAHPYMYVGGGNDRSQSNGCVVFKDYQRFLKAFKKGRINQLIVVPSLDELPTYMAQL